MPVFKIKKDDNPEGISFFTWMIDRTTKKNKNVILTVLGGTGSGKSYGCLRIGERMNELLGREPFDVTHCCRNLTELMYKVNNPKMRKGDVLILEEAGVNVGARDWQSRLNKMIGYIMQTFRNKNLVFLINLPDVRMLDSTASRLIHGSIITKGIDHSKKLAKFSFKVRQHNYQMHKDYWKFLRVKINGSIKKVKVLSLRKPSAELCKVYEARRLEFTDALNAKVTMEFEKADRKERESNSRGNGKPFTEIQEEIQSVWHSKTKVQVQIAEIMNQTPSGITQHMQRMDLKHPEWRKTAR